MAKKLSRKTLIIQCATEFSKKGYHGTSMSDLALACGGIEKSHFYYYFNGKDELFIEVLLYILAEAEKHIFEIMGLKQMSEEEKLEEIVTHALSYHKKPYNRLIALTATQISSIPMVETKEIIHDFFELWRKNLTRIYKSTHKKKKAKNLALLSTQDLQGAIILSEFYPKDDIIRMSLERAFDRLVED